MELFFPALIVIGGLLILLAIYAWNYRHDFKHNRMEAVFAFTVILPLIIFGLWAFFRSLM